MKCNPSTRICLAGIRSSRKSARSRRQAPRRGSGKVSTGRSGRLHDRSELAGSVGISAVALSRPPLSEKKFEERLDMVKAPKYQMKAPPGETRNEAPRDWHQKWESRVLHVFLICGLVLTLGRVLLEDAQRLYAAVEEMISKQPAPQKNIDPSIPKGRSALSPATPWTDGIGRDDHLHPGLQESAPRPVSPVSMPVILAGILRRAAPVLAGASAYECRITSTSPSLTMYSLPSSRNKPFSRTPGYPPRSIRFFQFTTSARMNFFSKSE